MKKYLQAAVLFSVGAFCLSAPSFADGLVFDPSSYPVAKAEATTGTYASAPSTAVTKTVNTAKVKDVADNTTRETNSLQNALFELDSAQTDVRNQLLDDRAKYTDIDNKYKLIKEQRKQQKKAVRESEKKIKQIEKTKKQIRNSMQLPQ